MLDEVLSHHQLLDDMRSDSELAAQERADEWRTRRARGEDAFASLVAELSLRTLDAVEQGALEAPDVECLWHLTRWQPECNGAGLRLLLPWARMLPPESLYGRRLRIAFLTHPDSGPDVWEPVWRSCNASLQARAVQAILESWSLIRRRDAAALTWISERLPCAADAMRIIASAASADIVESLAEKLRARHGAPGLAGHLSEWSGMDLGTRHALPAYGDEPAAVTTWGEQVSLLPRIAADSEALERSSSWLSAWASLTEDAGALGAAWWKLASIDEGRALVMLQSARPHVLRKVGGLTESLIYHMELSAGVDD